MLAGRLATILLFVASSSLVFALDTAKEAFSLILQVGAGTGLLYLVRWFWWRVTAWCEIVAMLSSFGVSVAFLILHRNGVNLGTHQELLATVMLTTICWLATAYLGPQDRCKHAGGVLQEDPAVRAGLDPAFACRLAFRRRKRRPTRGAPTSLWPWRGGRRAAP